MIKLKLNKQLPLHIPEFTCDDNPIGEHLNKYDMLSHLNKFSFDGIIGRPGSGKTSLLCAFLKGRGKEKIYRKSFDKILLVMPSSSRNSMKQNVFKKLPEDQMYDELDLGSMTDIYKRLLASTAEKEKTLLILDDVGASLKNAEIQTLFRKVIYNRRHLKVKIIVLLQSFLSCAKEIRKLFTNIFCYKPSKVEFENLADEIFEMKKDKANRLMNFCFDVPHQFLMINVESQRMYKGFDEILLPKEED